MNSTGRAIVVTTINPPTPAILELAQRSADWPMLVVGDMKTPSDWHVDGVRYLSPDDQKTTGLSLEPLLPFNHYCRKNIGYLAAIASGARIIAETDDDNRPRDWPPANPHPALKAEVVSEGGWINVYPFFTDEVIWPRGLPLDEVKRPPAAASAPTPQTALVHQYLAEGDPDVDAIYRLTVGKADHQFADRTLVLEPGAITPFNSQCTLWFGDSLAFLYLPSFVSFRMTDIWRSYIAQACMWASGNRVAYIGKGVYQERNEHNLHKDLVDELVGYERNSEIMRKLLELPLVDGPGNEIRNLKACYRMLTEIDVVPERELPLVDAWCDDFIRLTRS